MFGAESWLRLPDYAAFTIQTWVAFVLAGTAGWLLRVVVDRKPLQLPKLTERGLRLNSIGDWLVAVIVATLADHNLLFATIAGAGASTIVQFVMQALPGAICRALGLPEPKRPTEEVSKP